MSHQESIKNLILTNNRRLQLLKQQKARQGISVDPKIILEIEDIEVELEELKTELEALEDREVVDTVDWKTIASVYKEEVKELYGSIRVIGKSKPIPLASLYTEVYFLTKQSAERWGDIEELRKEYSRATSYKSYSKRLNGFTVLSENSRLFVLGKPGAGKSTFLKQIAIVSASNPDGKFPIFLSLKALADSNLSILEYIVREVEFLGIPDPQMHIHNMLKIGEVICLFDGLDEVSRENNRQSNLIAELETFIRHFNKNSYVITCRIAASRYKFERFTEIELADFSDEQVQNFVSKWFQNNDARTREFMNQFHKSDRLKELGRIPLLLSMLCLFFEEVGRFPENRANIVRECLNILLVHWDESRNIHRDAIYKELTVGYKNALLAYIGYTTFISSEQFIAEHKLSKYIERYLKNHFSFIQDPGVGYSLLKTIEAQHGIFVERAKNIYSFAHLSFQEYYASKYIAENASPKVLESLMSHIDDPRWREVFILTATQTDALTIFFEVFQQHIFLTISDEEKLVKLVQYGNSHVPNHFSYAERLIYRLTYLFLVTTVPFFELGHSLNISSETLNFVSFIKSFLDLEEKYAQVAENYDHFIEREKEEGSSIADDVYHLGEHLSELSSKLLSKTEWLRNNIHKFEASRLNLALSLYWLEKNYRYHGFNSSKFLNDTLLKNKDFVTKSLSEHVSSLDFSRHDGRNYSSTLNEMIGMTLGTEIFPTLSSSTISKLKNYFEAHKLLVDCLNVSEISKEGRKSILERMLTVNALYDD